MNGIHLALLLPFSLTTLMWISNPCVAAEVKLKKSFVPHPKGVRALAFSPNGALLAIGGSDSTISIWEVSTGKKWAILDNHWGAVVSLDFNSYGALLVSGSNDKTIVLWDLVSRKVLGVLKGHTEIVTAVKWCQEDSLVVSGSFDETIKLWDVKTLKEVESIRQPDRVKSFDLNSKKDMLAIACIDDSLLLSQVKPNKRIATLRGYDGAVTCAAFSPDGQTVAAGSADETVRIWNVTTAKETVKLTGYKKGVLSIAYNPKGTLLAAGSYEAVSIWDIKNQREIAKWAADIADAVAFSPDGKLLAYGCLDGSVKIYEIQE